MCVTDEMNYDDCDYRDDNDTFDDEWDLETKLHEYLFAEYMSSGGKAVYDFIRKGYVPNARLEYDRPERIWELKIREARGEWQTISCCRRGELYGKKVMPEFLNVCLGILDLSALSKLSERI